MSLEKYQSKSLTPVDEYHCTLSEELKKFAFDDFGETEEKRQNGIREMREWIMSNERIEKCRMDSKFILKFLRFRKYDMPKVKEAFEWWLIFHEGVNSTDWFSNLDYSKPHIASLVDEGLLLVLPKRDEFGRQTLLARLAVTDPNIPTIGDEALTMAVMIFELLLEDEENQIRGFNYIIDSSNIKLRHYFIFSFSTWFRIGKAIEATCAARHKSFCSVNLNPALRFIAKLALKHMPLKLRKRVKFYANFDELDIIPKAELPVECGGEASMNDLISPWRMLLESKKDYFLNVYNKAKVNRKYYPEQALNYDASVLKTPIEVLCAKKSLCNRSNALEID